VTQVQHVPLQQNLLASWSRLSDDDAAVLSSEMAITGCASQSYAVAKPALI